MPTIAVDQLSSADLHVDAVYLGRRQGNAGDDPFPALLGLSTQGGFRYRGDIAGRLGMLMLLTSGLSDPDWPDALDRETGVFTYYGDNKKPGCGLHDTKRGGNRLLQRVFADAHGGAEARSRVPPILLFARTGEWRDVRFLGLAVPGATGLTTSEDLVAVWRSTQGLRFQNYRARLTVLDAPLVSRGWIVSIIAGDPDDTLAPASWLTWRATGRLKALVASRSVEHRTRREQMPDEEGETLVYTIREHFRGDPHGFEHCAASIARMSLPDIATIDVTRPSRDGGRDAIGQLRLGSGPGSILVDFALEAKCYSPPGSVGVRDMSRLISRLRHRQFGIIVTTTWVDLQAYREIKEDGHPVIVIAAADIAQILRRNGFGSPDAVRAWLSDDFPSKQTAGPAA